MRPYQAGDDVRQIDWNVTARTGTPHVRIQLAERALVTWLVLDTSPSMAFGTAERRKADVAEKACALAVGQSRPAAGNRLGLVAFGVRTGAGAARGRAGAACCSRSPSARNRPGTVGSPGPWRCCDGLAVQRSLVVIVSDFRGPRDWRGPLLRVAGRHPTVAIEIRDPREQELADVGELRLVDPETGRQLRVDTSDRRACATRFGRGRRPRSVAGSCACSALPASGMSLSPPRATGCGRWPRSSSGATH